MEEEDILTVRCLGVPDSEVRDFGKVRLCTEIRNGAVVTEERKTATVFNRKMRVWETVMLGEAASRCPVCEKHLRVFFIMGTTWIAICGERCMRIWLAVEKIDEATCPMCGLSLERARRVFPTPLSWRSKKHLYSHTWEELCLYKLLS